MFDIYILRYFCYLAVKYLFEQVVGMACNFRFLLHEKQCFYNPDLTSLKKVQQNGRLDSHIPGDLRRNTRGLNNLGKGLGYQLLLASL